MFKQIFEIKLHICMNKMRVKPIWFISLQLIMCSIATFNLKKKTKQRRCLIKIVFSRRNCRDSKLLFRFPNKYVILFSKKVSFLKSKWYLSISFHRNISSYCTFHSLVWNHLLDVWRWTTHRSVVELSAIFDKLSLNYCFDVI